MARALHDVEWVRALAKPYLRGYRAQAAPRGALRGYWFSAPGTQALSKISPRTKTARTRISFFVGYLEDSSGFEFLQPQPPECLAFAAIEPIGGTAHTQLVTAEKSLFRHTAEYIRWLTHRPPHFQFFPSERIALVRHYSMRGWPRPKWNHFSRNFFIETLAWLVRSGLVSKLLVEAAEERETLGMVAENGRQKVKIRKLHSKVGTSHSVPRR